MTASISFEVAVEPHEPSGAFVARAADFPGKVGIGTTEAEAVADLRQRLPQPFLQPMSSPAPAGMNPWAALAEAFRHTPNLDEWRQEMADRRREADGERGVS